jgi:hypothetical protein
MDRQVKTQKDLSKQGALTNWRVQIDGQRCQDMERIQVRKGHSLPKEFRQVESGHGKESEHPRGTHRLESTEGQISQDTRKYPSENQKEYKMQHGRRTDIMLK